MIKTIEIRADRFVSERDVELTASRDEFDVAKIELDDEGKLVDKQALTDIVDHIKKARSLNPNGVIVTLFAHGWHHGGDWDDTHFVSFRKLLASLCVRELERSGPRGEGARRVIGVYLAWNGDPDDSWLAQIDYLTHLTFWNRYKTADKVGSGNDLHNVVNSITHATKDVLDENDDEYVLSPLILTGHSMGALIVELAFLSILKANSLCLLDDRVRNVSDIVSLTREDQSILSPDLVLALNSAADVEVAEDIKTHLEEQSWYKKVVSPAQDISYHPPVMISVTSTVDKDTGFMWPLAKFFRRTDGHSEHMFTHQFEKIGPALCEAAGNIDFGQSWHCVRKPQPMQSATPDLFIDLPDGKRDSVGNLNHTRYEIRSNDIDQEQLAWIFQIPGKLSRDHNDIFNPIIASFVLSLIQLSGAVMSLAYEWDQTFED